MKPVRITTLLLLLIAPFFTLSFSQERKVGDVIPAFSLLNDEGEYWNFPADLKSDYAVIFFYPAAMTGGCTTQACSYRDLQTDFASNNTQIIGISGDLPDGLKLFRKAHGLNFTLLSDGEGKIADLFGVPTREGGSITRNIDNKEVILKRNITTERWTFLIKKNGEIIKIEKGATPLTDGQNAKQYIINYKNNQK